jgi:soluble lytic murein transglycosylase-like protein
MKLSRLLLMVCLTVASAPALAGTLYRCMGPDAVPSYVSKRVAGAQCKVVAHSPPAAAVTAAPPAAATIAEPTATAQGGVTTPASVVTPTAATAKAPRFLGMATSITYSFVDANGVRNFSSRRPSGAANVQVNRIEYPIFSIDSCYACALVPGVNFNTVSLNTAAFASEIHTAAVQYGVEEAIVRAVIHAESAFHANVRSNKGAQGLMQLIPATAARFGVADPYDPAQNISGGVQYLAWLMKRYGSNLSLVAAAYNAGEGAVDRNGGIPPYAETRRYVDRVAELAERYRKALAGS